MKTKSLILFLLAFLLLSCNMFLDAVPVDQPPTEIVPGDEVAQQEPAAEPAEPTATPIPSPTPTPPPPTATPYLLKTFSLCPGNQDAAPDGTCCPYDYSLDPASGLCTPTRYLDASNTEPPTPRHGLWIVVVLPALFLGIPWLILEFFIVRYVQPKSDDVSQVLIKAQDGLFLEAAISMTARRELSLASSRMTWGRVLELVEKPVEQELIHEAIHFASLVELERNLKDIAESFKELPIIQELRRDFGVEVMRFNIEIRYPQETMDALNRKAEASAGGTAYLAYAAAAHLDPDSSECRELYRVYQETSGQVDAARNLGGGITSFAKMIKQGNSGENRDDDANV